MIDKGGEIGEIGENGENGEIGEIGENGENGEIGEIGEIGENGEIGEIGENGEISRNVKSSGLSTSPVFHCACHGASTIDCAWRTKNRLHSSQSNGSNMRGMGSDSASSK